MVLKAKSVVTIAAVIVLSACLISMFAPKSTAEEDQVSQKLSQILDGQRDILSAISGIASDIDSLEHDISIIKNK